MPIIIKRKKLKPTKELREQLLSRQQKPKTQEKDSLPPLPKGPNLKETQKALAIKKADILEFYTKHLRMMEVLGDHDDITRLRTEYNSEHKGAGDPSRKNPTNFGNYVRNWIDRSEIEERYEKHMGQGQ